MKAIMVLLNILFFMKKANLLFCLLISLNLYSQNENNINKLIEAFKELPEEVFTHKYGKLTVEKRNTVINNYIKKEMSDTFINLIRFDSFYGDIGLEYEIKFLRNIVAFRVQYSTHLTTEPGKIEFYSLNNNQLINISHEVLNSFNYWEDNYSKSVCDSLKKLYSDFDNPEAINKSLLYYFSGSDTLTIIENFILHFENGYQNYELDKKYFDGGFFTKKYIIDNGKLRLAE